MPIRDMPAFVKSHKNVKNAFFYCLGACFCLILQLLLMEKTAIKIVFDIIIPFSAAICFACYAITMAMDRPIILICPPTVYFVSLLLYQLISVEVGVRDTYPFITILELIPYAFFCVSVATCKFKKISDIVLKIFQVCLLAGSVVLVILAICFRTIIFINSTHYIMSTLAMICSFFAIVFIYSAMTELLIIAGIEKKVRQHKNESKENTD